MYNNFSDYYFLSQLRGDAPVGPWFKRTTLPEIDGTGAEAVERLEDYWHLVESAACLSVLKGRSMSDVLRSSLLEKFSPDGRRWERVSLRAVASEIVSCVWNLRGLSGPMSTDKDYLTEVPPEHWFVDTTKVNGDGQIEQIGEQDLYDKMNDFRPVVHSERYSFGDVLKTDDLRVLFYDMGQLSRFILPTNGFLCRYENLKDKNEDGVGILGPVIEGDPETYSYVTVERREDEDPKIKNENINIENNTFGFFGETGLRIYNSTDSFERYYSPVKLAWMIPKWWLNAITEKSTGAIKDPVMLVVVSCQTLNKEDNKSGYFKFLYATRAEVDKTPSAFGGGLLDRRWVTCEYDDHAIFDFAEKMVKKMKPEYFDRNKPGSMYINKAIYLDLSMTVKWKLPTSWSWTPD